MRSRALLSGNETGVVLVLCLITLALLTIIGMASTRTSRLEAEISGNDKTYKEAFYAAEMSLAVGETVVNSVLTRFDLEDGKKPGRYVKGTQPAWDQIVWNDTQSAVVTTIPSGMNYGSSKVAAAPRYTIEERDFRRHSLTTGIGVTTGSYIFTVRSQGTGASKAAHVLLESIYAKQYN
jgi:Tfp pilus assembly protein PilX